MTEQTVYYFDNKRDHPRAPEVVDAMLPFLREYGEIRRAHYHFGIVWQKT